MPTLPADIASFLYLPSLVLAVVALVGAVRAEWPKARTTTLVACAVAFGVGLSFLFTSGHSPLDVARAGVLYGLLAAGGLHVINFSTDKLGAAFVGRLADVYTGMMSSILKPAGATADPPAEKPSSGGAPGALAAALLFIVATGIAASQSSCKPGQTAADVAKPIAIAVVNGVCGGVLDHLNPTPAEQFAIDVACAAVKTQIGAAQVKVGDGVYFVPAKLQAAK